MRRFQKESQIWSFLADEYERGHSDEVCFRSGICLALSGLRSHSILTNELIRDCEMRLRERFKPRQPRWWERLWKKPHYSPYYWPVGETKQRASACDVLFHEAWNEENRAP